jgi:hypothetical protein
VVQAGPDKKRDPMSKIIRVKRAGGVAQMVEHLLSKREALKKKKKRIIKLPCMVIVLMVIPNHFSMIGHSFLQNILLFSITLYFKKILYFKLKSVSVLCFVFLA